MQAHDQYDGILFPRDSRFAGHLRIAGAESLAKLIGKGFWTFPEDDYDLHGVLADGKKVSLLDCVPNGRTRHRIGDENEQFESTIFPNYIVVGEEFICSKRPSIQAVRYHFKNLASMLSGHKTFRHLMPEPGEIRSLLEVEHKRGEKIALEHGWTQRAFEPEISERPHLLYFSGVWEIVATDAKIGKISLANRVSHGMGTGSGIGFDNEVTVNVEFVEPKTLRAAIHALYTLHGLFELCLGCRQRYDWIELDLTESEKTDRLECRQTARLFWSLCNERTEEASGAHLTDILLAPDRRPDEFAKVVGGWMDSAEDMGDPRERFATAFFGRYGINRIVGAANMFDLLPESHAPKRKEVDNYLKEAVNRCRIIFKALEDSSAKQSVLSSLGRVGTASLRDKIRHRAEKVVKVLGDDFSDIYMPCDQAVLARNHYVHGSKPSFDYREHITEFAFIADTLDFVFASSDLMELGWDLKGWIAEGTSMSHAFGTYLVNYRENIRRLNALVGE